MLNRYEVKSYSSAKYNAQLNLEGRTPYVNDDTLKFHHARILETDIHFDGLIFSLIESMSLDMHNTKRGFRYVVFDLAGNVISRVSLEASFKSKKQALKMQEIFLDNLDIVQVLSKIAVNIEKKADRDSAYLQELIDINQKRIGEETLKSISAKK